MKKSKTNREINKIKANFPDIYYISIGDNPKRWFDINDLYQIVTSGNKQNPITKEDLTNIEINKIVTHRKKYIKNDDVSKIQDILPLEERIDELETKHENIELTIEQLYSEFISLRDQLIKDKDKK